MALIYIIISACMFYFSFTDVKIGGYGIMTMYILCIAVILLSFASFLVKPNGKRAVLLAKEATVLSLPYVVTVILSAFIWIFGFAELRVMTRGFFYPFYQILSLLFACATLYEFGRKGVVYCMLSMVLASCAVLLKIIAENGLAAFAQDMVQMILSFGVNTSELTKAAETHDLTFALGVFFVGLLLDRKNYKHAGVWIMVVGFFLLTGLKRIGIVGIVMAVVVYFLLHFLEENTSRRLAMLLAVALVILAYGIIVAIQQGLFTFLEEGLGIDTKGRAGLYEYISKHIELSPAFVGEGLGSGETIWENRGYLAGKSQADAFHNDFLRMYCEGGFAIFFIWLILLLPVRTGYFFKKQGKNGGVLSLAYVIYLYCTYVTDNTLYYFYTNIAVFLLTMAYGLDELEEKELARYE